MICRLTSPASSISFVLSASIALALGGCSGGDDAAEAGAEVEMGPAMTTTPPDTQSDDSPDGDPADDGGDRAPDGTEEAADEDGPNVTGFDNSSMQADAESQATAEAALVPDTEHCAPVRDWNQEWVEFEDRVLELVNEFRSQPADCGEEGQFNAAPPLQMDPVLRCSARLHSQDMSERQFFDHFTPEGLDPYQRMAEAGFSGSFLGENIAQGQTSPEQVMEGWMASDGHCANIMRAEFTLIGVGFDAGPQTREQRSNFWTQNFGAPLTRR